MLPGCSAERGLLAGVKERQGCQVGLSSLLRCEKRIGTWNSNFGALNQSLSEGIKKKGVRPEDPPPP